MPGGTAPAVDPLDALFERHDEGDLSDVGLVSAIADLKPNAVDAEGDIYGGLAALVVLALADPGELATLSPKELKHDVRSAFHDIELGLKHLPEQDVAALGALVESQGSSLLPIVEAAVEDLSTLAQVHLPKHGFDLFL